MPIYWKRKYTKLSTMMGKRDRKNGLCLADAARVRGLAGFVKRAVMQSESLEVDLLRNPVAPFV